MKITDEMIKAFRTAWDESLADHFDPTQRSHLLAALGAVAPLIAAQALRRAAERVDERSRDLRADFRSGAYGIEYINGMEDAVGVVERTSGEFAALSGGTPEPTDG